MNRRPGQVDHTCHTLDAHEIASLETCSMMNSTETLHELQYLFALQRSNIQSLGVDPLSATVNQKYVAIRPILLKAIVAVACCVSHSLHLGCICSQKQLSTHGQH